VRFQESRPVLLGEERRGIDKISASDPAKTENARTVSDPGACVTNARQPP
jgi:hypothetical protein